jgi:P4 family phage/plasmid primase-like protien
MSLLNSILCELAPFKTGANPDDNKATHTGLWYPVQGAWTITKKEDVDLLWLRYTKLLNESLRKPGGLIRMGLSEVQEAVGPLLVDIDFKWSVTKGVDRRYTREDIRKLMEIYEEVIERYVEADEAVVENNNVGYVLEKKRPRRVDDGLVKDGFHAIFPKVVLRKDIRVQIHKDVRSCIGARTDIFMGLLEPNKESVIDECAATNNWLMYGSHKRDDKYAYMLTGVYRDHQLLDPDFDPRTDPRIFSIRGQQHKEATYKPNVAPLLAPSSNQNTTEPHEMIHGKARDLYMCRQLLDILSPERMEEEPLWIRVGWCLHNISTDNLRPWIEWSRQSPKFREGECEKHWGRFRNEGYKLPSLCNWARNDNPALYEAFIRENAKVYLEYSINCGAHYDIATIMYSKYSDRYRSINPKRSDEWYFFDEHHWKEMPGGYILMNKMSQDLSRDFMDMANVHKRAMLTPDMSVVKEHKEKRDKCVRLEYQVKDNGFKTGVLKECARMFFDVDFSNKLDQNPNLVCFVNGMYDLVRDEFRDGQPDDYVSKTTNIKYDTSYTMEHDTIQEIYAFLRKVQPIPEMLNYIMTVLSSFLGGSTQEQTFQIWTGSGSNGKSTIIELFEKTFGDDYCGKFPVTLLTKERASSNACTPELQDVMCKRFASMQEPNDNDIIHTGAMKEYTGGDKIYSRGLFSKPTPFKPQFKLVLLCNKMPIIKGWDYGVWRRLKVTNFTSSFVDSPNPENETEFKKDKTLSEKFDSWREAFMWLLVHYLKQYKRHGIVEPTEVSVASIEYKKRSDGFMQFLDDNFTFTNNDRDRISMQEIYEAFRMWFRNTNSGPTPNKQELLDYLNANGKIKKLGKNWFGGLLPQRVEL